MSTYYRPILNADAARPEGAMTLAGGWTWFTHAERLSRDRQAAVVPATDIPQDIVDALTRPRPDLSGLTLNCPRLMGILNVTPDSFSDGGDFADAEAAQAQGRAIVADGADIIDIGGESTRPGAETVPTDVEITRTAPVIAALHAVLDTPISIDTRKAPVARAAVEAGAKILNDVSALAYDPALGTLAADFGLPICLMHTQGEPKTMALDPRYDNVLLDVYDHLALQLQTAMAAGISRDKVILDPGIGFGKTQEHNLILLRNISLFHGLGCPILLGVSRKRFIGALAQEPDAKRRAPGSIAVALAAVAQGVQILRVHDIRKTRQALDLHMAVTGAGAFGA
jgi:dihydropteroate synthase